MISPAISEILTQATVDLADGCGATARLDAEILLADLIGCQRLTLLTLNEPLTDAQVAAFAEAIIRRTNGEPAAYITGTQAFWEHDFLVSPATLIPRQDTETLVEVALKGLQGKPDASILDVGTGSGCILLSLLAELPEAHGVGVDISQAALDIAAKNAAAIGVDGRVVFTESNWFAAVPQASQRYDCIVSNPPYIPSGDIEGLMADVKGFEPRNALDGGADGLEAYRVLVAEAPRFLSAGGSLTVEIGVGQAVDVTGLFVGAGFIDIETIRDLPGIERVIAGKMP